MFSNKKDTDIYYDDVMSLKFKRIDSRDSVFFNQYGFEWFIVEKKLNKRTYLDWNCVTNKVQLVRTDKEGYIIGKVNIRTLSQLKEVITFYKNKKGDWMKSDMHLKEMEKLDA